MSGTTSTSRTNTSNRLTGSVDTFRTCSSCKKLRVPITSRFKLCSECREKRRVAVKRYRENKKALRAANSSMRRVDDSSRPEGISKLFTTDFTPMPTVLELICTEYQTSSELFAALKFLSLSSNHSRQPLQFHGSYTIVAASDIDNLQRVWLLATELSAKSWLPFQLEPSLSLIGDESIQTLQLACLCSATSALSHRNDENVPATSTNIPFVTRRLCRGVLTLQSLVDHTHPLGIPGQHIVVRMEHPFPSYVQN